MNRFLSVHPSPGRQHCPPATAQLHFFQVGSMRLI